MNFVNYYFWQYYQNQNKLRLVSIIISGMHMGTKIVYNINLLAASPNSSSFTVRCVNYWERFRNSRLKGNCSRTGVDNFGDPMDKKLEKQHILEPIKRTMQMHEDVFKHQVANRTWH